MNAPDRQSSSFFSALRGREIWRRAAPIGLTVGFLQATVHQGAHWIRYEITSGVVLKSIASLLIGLTLAVVSAAAAQSKTQKHRHDSP